MITFEYSPGTKPMCAFSGAQFDVCGGTGSQKRDLCFAKNKLLIFNWFEP